MISTVSHEYRCSWDEACQLSVILFLNVYSFVIARKNREIELQKESLRKAKNRS